MRFSTLIILAAAIAAGFTAFVLHRRATAPRRAFAQLLAHEGRSLDQVPEAASLLDVALKRPPGLRDASQPAPWRMARLGTRLVVLEKGGIYFYPDVRAYVFSEDGDLLSLDGFSIGGRGRDRALDVGPADVPGFASPLLLITLDDRPLSTRGYYALVDTRLTLVRAEDASGTLVRNVFDPGYSRTGPPPKVDDVDAALASQDPAVVLETLTWLGGEHKTPPAIPPSRIAELRKSPNAWIREAAENVPTEALRPR